MQTLGTHLDPLERLKLWMTAPFGRDVMQEQMQQAQAISNYFLPQSLERRIDEETYRPRAPVLNPEMRPWLGPIKIGEMLQPKE